MIEGGVPNVRLAFTFHSCLGEGGFGEVYLATQHTEGGITRDVAVKVLHERFHDGSDAVKRLRDEGQALAMLAHPCILSVHEFARVDGRLALVTEYVEGVDLSHFCVPERLLPVKVAVQVLREISEALAFALTTLNPLTGRPLELIHRDVKPANIRISVDGKVKLLDFGVARTQEINRQAKTAMGDVLLTLGYGAPEALAFGVSGPSVDVFALAASAYEMFAGTPFYGISDLQYQLSLALDSEDYALHLDKRLEAISNLEVRALLKVMMGFAHETRITAAEASDRADEILGTLDGPSLGKWCRDTKFPDHSYATAEFCGRRINAEGVVATPTPAPRSSRAPAEVSVPPVFGGGGDTLDLTHPPAPSRVPPPPDSVLTELAILDPPVSSAPARPRSRLPLILAAMAVLGGALMFVFGIVALVVVVVFA